MPSRPPADPSGRHRDAAGRADDIQSHGAMLVCNADGDRVLHASRNIRDITGHDGKLIPGISVAELLGPQAAHDLRNAAARAGRPCAAGIVLALRLPASESLFDAVVHRHGGRVFMEIEPAAAPDRNAGAALDLTRSLIQRIGGELNVETIARTGARLVRAVLGHDRVTVYRFLEDGAARAVAEARSPAAVSFLGRHVPAADIEAEGGGPPVAGCIRMIADVGGAPVALDPPPAESGEPLDMAFTQLRGVSPADRAYLRERGIAAVLSIPIATEGQMWGLIVCHHDSPRLTPVPLRIGAELFGHSFSMQIANAERRTAMQAARDLILRQNEQAAEERKRDERRRRILNDELNHRVKNIISLVKSIALHSGSSASSVAEYAASLEGRLLALANAHDQSLGNGSGDIVTLVDTEAGFYRDESAPDRITTRGPHLGLDDRAFRVLALVVHEMITNAAKYGALSVTGGRLDIAWGRTGEGDIELTWTERDGPPVRAPDQVGFGTRLIRSSIEYDLRGTVELAYRPAGLSARFVIPGRHVDAPQLSQAATAPAPAAPGSLAGLSILVVEDHGLIAMDVEETLRRLGAADVRLAATVDEAEKMLAGFDPDAAVLDLNLGDGNSEPVAAILLARGIPFIFMTGYSDDVVLGERFRRVPMVRKPIDLSSLGRQIGVALAPGGGS